MSTPVETIDPDRPAQEAAERLRDQDPGSLVVTEDDEITGIVTSTDILNLAAHTGDFSGIAVKDIMSTPVTTINADEDVDQAKELFRGEVMTSIPSTSRVSPEYEEKFTGDRIQKLPVVENGDLVGIITTSDLSYYTSSHAFTPAGDIPDEEERPTFDHPDTFYEKQDWKQESHGMEDGIDIGDSATFSKTLTEQDVRRFADVTGDTNRVHLDEEFAAETRFGRRIAHGVLSSGVISAALARLPGLIIFLSQEVTFSAPVDWGERVTAQVTVVESIGENRYRLETNVYGEDDQQVVEGEAVVMSDRKPDV